MWQLQGLVLGRQRSWRASMPAPAFSTFNAHSRKRGIMNRTKVKALHDKLNEVMEQFASDNGVAYVPGSGSFDEAEVTFKVTFAETDENGLVMSREMRDYEQVQEVYGLPPLLTVFKQGGDEFRIVGWKSRSRKYPVIAERVSDGTRFKFPKDTVVRKCA